MGIVGHSSVEEFFQEVLAEALGHAGTQVSPSTEFYLVSLLGEFASARISDRPLGLCLVSSEDPADRLNSLKEIGDTSLYVAGFFAESISRKLVDIGYYMGMGGAAYRELSHKLDSSSVAEVYDELSTRFPELVDVLNRIRSQVNVAGQDTVALYHEWCRTRSDWIEERLSKMGVLVSPNAEEDGGYLQ